MSRLTMLLPLACLKRYLLNVLPEFEWVCVALLEFKSWPGLDEGIFESYVHLNIVVPALSKHTVINRHMRS